jgi:hypothetical protein
MGREIVERALQRCCGGFVVVVWTREGLKLTLPAKYREVTRIPWLEPWGRIEGGASHIGRIVVCLQD